jgi:hypothetical protein
LAQAEKRRSQSRQEKDGLTRLFRIPYHGAMAEWLGRGLQNLVHRFNSGSRLQPKTPVKTGVFVFPGLNI